MLTLATTNTLVGSADAASAVTMTVFGNESASGADAFKVVYQGQLPSSPTTLYTVPGSTITLIDCIQLVNLSAADRTVDLKVLGTGAANRIAPQLVLDPYCSAQYNNGAWTVNGPTGPLFAKDRKRFSRRSRSRHRSGRRRSSALESKRSTSRRWRAAPCSCKPSG